MRGTNLTMLTLLQKAILEKRGIPESEMEAFVEAKVDNLHNPLLLKGVEAAAEMIESAIYSQKKICLIGDFDADGITSTALMLLALKELGANNVVWYINNRFEFGYGLQLASLQDVISRYGQIDLIITVDNGITSVEAIKSARSLGIQVIVTDHHEIAEILPDANVIINPKQPDCFYPDKNLAGVGVAFKLVQHLFNRKSIPRRALLYLDLVAIGTVADVMNITGENRIFVKNGLKLINWEKARQGVNAIKKVFNIQGEVSAYHLGFCFGPLLNVQGRLEGSPEKAISILTTKDINKASFYAQELYVLNKERQKLTEQQVQKTLNSLDARAKFIVHYDEHLHEGLVGLIAGRVKEHFYLPTLILTKDEKQDGVIKGSARSIEGFNIKKHLVDECQDILIKGGGHAMAAGVSLRLENLPELARRLGNAIYAYSEELFRIKIAVDYIVDAKAVNVDLVQEIHDLAPFGVGFPTPTIQMDNFNVKRAMCFGKEGKHLKLVDDKGIEILLFDQGKAYEDAKKLQVIHPAGTLSKNEWNGLVKIQFMTKENPW